MGRGTVVAVVGLAVVVLLGLAGCQRPHIREAVAVASSDQGVLVTVRSDTGDEEIWRLRDDAELTQRWVSERPRTAKTQDCTGSYCYRVVPGQLAIQASRDGGQTFRTVWSISGEAYDRLARDYQGVSPR